MAKKPLIGSDSLELLLDTMCNTFGGVMFIAIALVVISSFIPKIVVEIDEDLATAAKVQDLQTKINQLQQKLTKQQLERSLKEQLVKKFKNHPHLEKIKEFGRLKDENAKLVLLTSEVKAKKNAWMVAYKMGNRKNKKQTSILTQQKLKLRDLTDKETIQKNEIDEKQDAISKFIKDNIHQETRTIGVSPRSETALTPFIFVMKHNKLYRVHNFTQESLFDGTKFDHCDDVNVELGNIPGPGGKNVKAIIIHPIAGKGLFLNPTTDNKTELNNLFRKIDKNKRFIWVMVNKDSFDSFIKLREFLRDRKYKLYWYPVVDEYFLTIADEGAYEAGE